MAHKIEFTKSDKINGQEYKKGNTLSVSASIYVRLKANGSVKDFKPKSKSLEED